MGRRLLLATDNPGKQRELRELLVNCGWDLVSPEQLGITLNTKETGQTYAENATIKALAAARAARIPAIADDSGLEVRALGGEPGLYSARYAGAGASDADRRAKLLAALARVPEGKRNAEFVCAIAIAVPATPDATDVYLKEGRCEGEIVREERGNDGFGYDPVFLLPTYGKTMAELPPGEKNALSHRGQAARLACEELKTVDTYYGMPHRA